MTMPAYMDTLLRPGERIIYQPRLSTFILIIHLFLGALCLAVLVFFGLKALVYTGIFHWKFLGPVKQEEMLQAAFFLLFAGLLLYFGAKYLYDYCKTEIAVTDQRIIGRVPRLLVAFSLQTVDLPLAAIEKIYYSTYYGHSSGSGGGFISTLIMEIIAGLISALADYGTVVVVDKEGHKTKFRTIVSPKELQQQIEQAAKIGEFAPAGAAAGGIAEKAMAQRFARKLVVGSLAAGLIITAGILIYYDQPPKTAPVAAQAPATKASPPATATAKPPAPKGPPTAAEYVQQGLREKNPEQKIALYTKALELDPKYAVALQSRGYIYLTQKKFEPALADLNQALALKPDFAVAHYTRGGLHYAQNNYDQAIADYSRAITLKPDYAPAYNDRGNAYFRKKDFDQAINEYGKAIELKPDFAVAFSNRGNTWFEKKDYDRALADYAQAIKLKPDYAWPYYRRAVIYNLKGEAEQARRDYDQAKALNPKTPELAIK
jgi:tetratricopeptide (TPR) repeat protein